MDGPESGLDSPSRRNVLQGAAAVPLLSMLRPRRAGGGPGRPRNLLVLVADDMGRVAPERGSGATPVLDRLASEGMDFTRAFTPVPVCRPARTCMYTGSYPQRSGIVGFDSMREDVATWPEILNEARCATAMIGKLHVTWERMRFDHMKGGPPFVEDRSHAAYAQAFEELLESVCDRRFVAVVNFGDPHRPFEGTEATAREADPTWKPHDPESISLPPFLVDTPETRADLAAYHDAVRRLDATIGTLLESLDHYGLREETLVIFTSDNGMPFPFAKTTLYEPGIHVPMIARWPGIVPAGSSCETLVGLIDLLPTAMEIFGAKTENEQDGRSLLPLLRGEDFVRELIFASHTEHKRGREAPSRAVRGERYKYVHNFRPDVEFYNNTMGTETWKSWEREARERPELAERLRRLRFRPAAELFDLQADPWERRNLAGDPDHAALERELRGRMKEWMAALGDAYAEELSDS